MLSHACKHCGKAHAPGHPQWKCCPTHTSEQGPDWVCDGCAVKLHPEKAGIVTHAMFNDQGILPCCGVHRLEARQSDRIATGSDDIVTCTGAKRYEENRHARRMAGRRQGSRRPRG